MDRFSGAAIGMIGAPMAVVVGGGIFGFVTGAAPCHGQQFSPGSALFGAIVFSWTLGLPAVVVGAGAGAAFAPFFHRTATVPEPSATDEGDRSAHGPEREETTRDRGLVPKSEFNRPDIEHDQSERGAVMAILFTTAIALMAVIAAVHKVLG